MSKGMLKKPQKNKRKRYFALVFEIIIQFRAESYGVACGDKI
jgi:hypothetical protein